MSRIALITLASLVALAGLAHASTQSGTYTGGLAFVGVQCNDACGLSPGTNVGGYHFAANGNTPIAVNVTDNDGRPIYFEACQDPNANGTCGETGEPTKLGCGSTKLKGFLPSLDTVVFVYSYGPGCLGPATTGTIVVTYSP